MAICTPVPTSELFSNYQLMPQQFVERHRVIIVGPDFAVRTGSVDTGYNFLANYTATGITATAYPNLGTDTIDQASVSAFLSNALVQLFNPDAVTGPYTIANGRQFTTGGTTNKIIHNATAATGSANDTVWAGTGRSGTVAADVVVGDYVRLFNNTVYFYSRVKAIEASGANTNPAARDVLVLEDALPAGFQGTNYFSVVVCEIVSSINVPTASLTRTSSTVAVAALTAATERTGSARPVLGGQNNVGVFYSRAFVSYRALRNNTALVNKVNSVVLEEDLDAFFSAEERATATSELAFAITRALRPVTSGLIVNDAPVQFIAIATNDSAGYSAAIAQIQRRRDFSLVVPLTQDPALLGLFTTMLGFRSSAASNLWTEAFYTLPLVTRSNVIATPTAQITAASSTVSSVTLGAFNGVLPGDILLYNGAEYPITVVVTSQQLTISGTLSIGAGTTAYSIQRPLTVAQQAADYGSRASAFANAFINVVFPPAPTFNGVVVAPYHLAAALAGLRNYTVAQQGLRGVALPSGWAVPQSSFEFSPYMETLAAEGVFVVGPREDTTGALVWYPNTTDQTSESTRTENAVFNSYALLRYFYEIVDCYSGRWKVNDALFAELRNVMTTEISALSGITVGRLGAALVSGTVGEIVRDPINAARVIVPLSLVIATDLGDVVVDAAVTLN